MQGVTVTLDELLALRYVASQLRLPQTKITSHSQQGGYQSPFRGRGMDFLETRIYQPGDDIRSINWAVTARTGRTHTKIYQQERDRPIYVIVDFKPSMYFGTKKAFKSVVAAQAAAMLAWAALKNNDRVGGLLLKDKYYFLPPLQRKINVIEFLKQLVNFVTPTYDQVIDYSKAFLPLRKIMKSGSLIYFISDFYFYNETLKKELQQLAKFNDVTSIFIYDPLEKTPPSNGQYLFHDQVNSNSILVNTKNNAFCTKYSEHFQTRLNNIKQLSFATGMQFTELATNEDIIPVLHRLISGSG